MGVNGDHIDVSINIENVDNFEDPTQDYDEFDDNVKQNENSTFDLYDPRNWDTLDINSISTLALNGPKRDLELVKGPRNSVNRSFSSTHYIRSLPDGETCDRE